MSPEYKYLFANLLGLLPLGALLLFARRQRSMAVICGAILTVYCPPVSWLYERVYWAPERILGGAWGIEDLMFCFHAGAVSWLCAVVPWGARVHVEPALATTFRRLLWISLLAILFLVVFLALNFTVLSAFLLAQTISSAIILIMRPSYWRFVISGAPLFTAYYFLLLGLWRLLMPGFMGDVDWYGAHRGDFAGGSHRGVSMGPQFQHWLPDHDGVRPRHAGGTVIIRLIRDPSDEPRSREGRSAESTRPQRPRRLKGEGIPPYPMASGARAAH